MKSGVFLGSILGLCLLGSSCVALQLGETRIQIINETGEQFKIRATNDILVCHSAADCPGFKTPVSSANINKFLGLFVKNTTPVTFDWLPRSIAWKRNGYRIYSDSSSLDPVDLLVETGAEWSYAIARCGGSWGTTNMKNYDIAEGTDRWIKMGAYGLKFDAPTRIRMQIGPRTNCSISGSMTLPPYPDYQIRFTQDGSPDAWMERHLTPGKTNIVLKNSTPIEWEVIAEGFNEPNVTIDNKRVFQLGQGVLEKVLAFNPTVPRDNITDRNGTVYLTCTPKQSSAADGKGGTLTFEKFVLALYKVKTLEKPILAIGSSRFALSKNLSMGNIGIGVIQKDNQYRFEITIDQLIGMKRGLHQFIQEQRAGRMDIPTLKQKIDAVLHNVEVLVKQATTPMDLAAAKKSVINFELDGMAPVLWFGNNWDMIEFFAARGADLTIQDGQLLYYAIGSNAHDVIDKLMEKNIVPGPRHIEFGRTISRAMAELLVKKLVQRMIEQKNQEYCKTIFGGVVDLAMKAGDYAFAEWATDYTRGEARRHGAENLMQGYMLDYRVKTSCPRRATIELQKTSTSSVDAEFILSGGRLAVPAAPNFVTFDTICQPLSGAAEVFYKIFVNGTPIAIVKCLFWANESDGFLGMSAQIRGPNAAPTDPALQDTGGNLASAWINGREIKHTFPDGTEIKVMTIKEGGQSKFKIYVGKNCVAGDAVVEIQNQQATQGIEVLRLDTKQNHVVPHHGAWGERGFSTLDRVCRGPEAVNEVIYQIKVNGAPFAHIKFLYTNAGQFAAHIRDVSNTQILRHSGIYQNIPLEPAKFQMNQNMGAYTVSVVVLREAGQDKFKIYFQHPSHQSWGGIA